MSVYISPCLCTGLQILWVRGPTPHRILPPPPDPIPPPPGGKGGIYTAGAKNADVIVLFLMNLHINKKGTEELRSRFATVVDDPEEYIFNEEDEGLAFPQVPALKVTVCPPAPSPVEGGIHGRGGGAVTPPGGRARPSPTVAGLVARHTPPAPSLGPHPPPTPVLFLA